MDAIFTMNAEEEQDFRRHFSFASFAATKAWVEEYTHKKNCRRLAYSPQTAASRSAILLAEIERATTFEGKHQAIAKWVKVRNQDYYEVYT